jgi:hypothetical protein
MNEGIPSVSWNAVKQSFRGGKLNFMEWIWYSQISLCVVLGLDPELEVDSDFI